MNTVLYTPEILRLAVEVARYTRLSMAQGSESARTPICGSHITVDMCLDGMGRICAVGMAVHACAIGQAAAALFAAGAVGRTGQEVEATADALARWLNGERAIPPDWPGIDTLAPALPHSARHAAILLPFRTGFAAACAAASGSKE